MTQRRLPSAGEQFTATVSNLAIAYEVDEQTMHVAVYALAEQMHRHYCLSRGMVNHSESRPDQDVAVSVLAGLAGGDWWLVRAIDRVANLAAGPLDEPDTVVPTDGEVISTDIPSEPVPGVVSIDLPSEPVPDDPTQGG